ncbi:MAG: hypothetical protein R3B12_01115 [Candidatus Saccharimonadales bacterium]
MVIWLLGVVLSRFNTSGNDNSAFGGNALAYNTIGTFNSAFGRYSLWYNSSGSYNVAMGGYSLSNNTIGNNNTAVGYQSLRSDTTSEDTTLPLATRVYSIPTPLVIVTILLAIIVYMLILPDIRTMHLVLMRF